VTLQRPATRPLSPVALLGEAIFFDASLSASRRLACATCHSPEHAFGPPNDLPAQLGGLTGRDQGARAVPGLRYLDRTPNFSIGPDNAGAEGVNVAQLAARNAGTARPTKTAGATPAGAMVPQGGLFWDGRANTLQQQASVPLFNPAEMANTDIESVAARLRAAPYRARFAAIFGPATVATAGRLVDEAMFAVARFEIEDSAFHPYDSKYDAYLEGRAELTPAEARGLAVYEDPARGNCAGCHLDRPSVDGMPPTFTDFQYEAIGVPRNDSLRQNHDPDYHDLGLCGPIRHDLAAETRYCGMFRTPTLRNVATRAVFFHNGVYHTLTDVLRFYRFRDVRPEEIYPARDGRVDRFDDLPAQWRGNVDTTDPPFNRRAGDPPPLTDADVADLIAFLRTLTDGYHPAGSGRAGGS